MKEVEEDLREAFKAGLKEFLQQPRSTNEEDEDNAFNIPVIKVYLDQVAFKTKFYEEIWKNAEGLPDIPSNPL